MNGSVSSSITNILRPLVVPHVKRSIMAGPSSRHSLKAGAI
jgi:hypothetical protein